MIRNTRRIRLFKQGQSKVLIIPREFEIAGDEAIMRKEGDRLVLEPVRKTSLLDTLRALGPLVETFPDVDDFPGPADEPKLHWFLCHDHRWQK